MASDFKSLTVGSLLNEGAGARFQHQPDQSAKLDLYERYAFSPPSCTPLYDFNDMRFETIKAPYD
jgi:hypothetical protein